MRREGDPNLYTHTSFLFEMGRPAKEGGRCAAVDLEKRNKTPERTTPSKKKKEHKLMRGR